MQDEVPLLVHPWARPTQPGCVNLWLSLLIVLGLIVSLLLVVLTMLLYQDYLGQALYPWHIGIALVTMILLWVWRRRAQTLSTILRLCVVILGLHIALLLSVQGIWCHVSSSDVSVQLPLTTFPAGFLLLVVACLLLVVVQWSGRRHTRNILPLLGGLTIFSLTFLLVLGLWLPIALAKFTAFNGSISYREPAEISHAFVWITLLPSLLLALATTSQHFRLASLGFSGRVYWGTALLFALMAAIKFRVYPEESEDLAAYANFVPILLLSAGVAVLSICAMGLVCWQVRQGPSRSADLRGELIGVKEKGRVASQVRYLGWLGGLRAETTQFVIRTSTGDLPVPSGVRVIAPLPSNTTNATLDDTFPLLEIGDQVEVWGLESAPKEGAFRSSPLPVPGACGIVVRKLLKQPSSPWQEMTLTTWRPIMFYLFVVSLVALPGLAGYLGL